MPLSTFLSRNLINLEGNVNLAPRKAFIAHNDLPIMDYREVLLSFSSESPRLDPSVPLSELDIALGVLAKSDRFCAVAQGPEYQESRQKSWQRR